MVRPQYAGRLRNIYDKARSPARRLLESTEVPESLKSALRAQMRQWDPFRLKAEIARLQNKLLSVVWRLTEKRAKMGWRALLLSTHSRVRHKKYRRGYLRFSNTRTFVTISVGVASASIPTRIQPFLSTIQNGAEMTNVVTPAKLLNNLTSPPMTLPW